MSLARGWGLFPLRVCSTGLYASRNISCRKRLLLFISSPNKDSLPPPGSESGVRTIYTYRRGEIGSGIGAQDFVKSLRDHDRRVLLVELTKFEKELRRNGPSSAKDGENVVLLGDPPSMAQLKAVALFNAVPFIGFGFLDNFIMIIAGDYIDSTLCFMFSFSTLTAAALGNLISDLFGVGLAGYVEAMASNLGFKTPELSLEQLDMSKTRWSAGLGRAVGVAIGCVLGMFPLIWLGEDRDDKDGSDTETPPTPV